MPLPCPCPDNHLPAEADTVDTLEEVEAVAEEIAAAGVAEAEDIAVAADNPAELAGVEAVEVDPTAALPEFPAALVYPRSV